MTKLEHALYNSSRKEDFTMAVKERETKQEFPNSDLVEALKNDNEFMDGVLEGFEDYRNSRTELWSDVKKELDLGA